MTLWKQRSSHYSLPLVSTMHNKVCNPFYAQTITQAQDPCWWKVVISYTHHLAKLCQKKTLIAIIIIPKIYWNNGHLSIVKNIILYGILFYFVADICIKH